MTDELLGRDDELTAIRTAQARKAPGLIVSAPAGMGRTSVLSAMVSEWRDRRLDVQFVRATASARQLRFAALSSIIGDLFEGPLTFDLVSDALAARAAHGRFLLVIDDLHLLDEASVRVLADAVGRHDSFILASIDDSFLGQDPLSDSAALGVLRLGPLSAAAIGAMVERRVQGAVDAESWWDRCGGNPTVLLGLLDVVLPRVERHVSGADLSPAGRRLLNVIALAEPLPLDAATTLGGLAAVDELRASGIIALSEDGRVPVVRLRHPGLAPRLRRSLGPLEARGARRAALAVLRDSWPQLGATGRLRLAALAIDAGVELTDEELVEATTLAPSAGDATLSLRLAREAARRLHRFEDFARLADVAHEQGEIGDLEDAIERMQASATTPAERATTAVARAQHLLWRLADGDAAVQTLADPDVADDPEAAALRSRILATIGRIDESTVVALPLLQHPSPRVRTQALIGTGHALRRAGRPAEAVEVLDEALTDAAMVTDPVLAVSKQVLSVARAHALTESGSWKDGLAQSTVNVEYAERYDEAPGRAVAILIHGVAQLEAGSPRAAIESLDEALLLFESLRQPAGRRWATSARALAHGLRGDAVAARNDLDRLDQIGAHPADLFPAFEPRARAWAAVAAADPEAARQILRRATSRFREARELGPAWSCAHDLVSLDDPSAVLELAPAAAEPFDHVRVAHARATMSKESAPLAALVDHFASAGGLRWAAECAVAWSSAATRAGDKDEVRRANERLDALLARCDGLDIPSVATGRALALTTREREIALLAARGLTSRAIGDRLGLSVRTVDNHLARCFDKLGARNRSELAALLTS